MSTVLSATMLGKLYFSNTDVRETGKGGGREENWRVFREKKRDLQAQPSGSKTLL